MAERANLVSGALADRFLELAAGIEPAFSTGEVVANTSLYRGRSLNTNSFAINSRARESLRMLQGRGWGW